MEYIIILQSLIIVISVFIIHILTKKIQILQKQCFNLLEQDKGFQIFIENSIKQNSDDIVCIKAINSKYHIGVLNSKLLFDKFKIDKWKFNRKVSCKNCDKKRTKSFALWMWITNELYNFALKPNNEKDFLSIDENIMSDVATSLTGIPIRCI